MVILLFESYSPSGKPWDLVNTGQTANTIQNNEVWETHKSSKTTYMIPHLQDSTLIGWSFYKQKWMNSAKVGFKTHFARQNNIPCIAHYSPLGIFEKWRYARCFPSTLGHLKYLYSSNNSLNMPFVFRLGGNGFGLRWCTPAATTAATRMSVNAPIKHFLNEGLWACLLLLQAWQECGNILMSLGCLT